VCVVIDRKDRLLYNRSIISFDFDWSGAMPRARLREERRRLILDLLRENRQVTVAELADRFQVSQVTVRRDLGALSEEGYLQRAHGGAVATASPAPEMPIVQRISQQREFKEAIGRAAAHLINEGESVFIGSGSTTIFVARHLVNRKSLTVITNALNIATELAAAPGVTVVVTGGMMRDSELSLIGHIAQQSLQEVRVDKVVVGIPAISLDAGLTNDYLPEVITDRAIIDMAPELILVADHSKFGKVASAYLAPLKRVSTLVTDSRADRGMLARLEQMGIQIIIAEPNEKRHG
jgi:DeoR/GlpR family transcriptional regulator of sugar metabolism